MRDTRGNVAQEHLIAVTLVALAGVTGFVTLGSSMHSSIALSGDSALAGSGAFVNASVSSDSQAGLMGAFKGLTFVAEDGAAVTKQSRLGTRQLKGKHLRWRHVFNNYDSAKSFWDDAAARGASANGHYGVNASQYAAGAAIVPAKLVSGVGGVASTIVSGVGRGLTRVGLSIGDTAYNGYHLVTNARASLTGRRGFEFRSPLKRLVTPLSRPDEFVPTETKWYNLAAKTGNAFGSAGQSVSDWWFRSPAERARRWVDSTSSQVDTLIDATRPAFAQTRALGTRAIGRFDAVVNELVLGSRALPSGAKQATELATDGVVKLDANTKAALQGTETGAILDDFVRAAE